MTTIQSSPDKIGSDFNWSLQFSIGTPFEDTETQLVSETILWQATLQREVTVSWIADDAKGSDGRSRSQTL